MADINDEIKKIGSAVYGKEVREAMVNAFELLQANKPDADDVYLAEEADEHFLSKYDAGNTYATKTTTYTKNEVDTDLLKKSDKTDVLSDEVNLLNITGIGAHTSSTYTYTLGENSITVTNKNDSALNLSLTLLDGKISCHGTTGDSDVTIKLNASANCNGEYMFAILNQQSQKNSYPSVYLSKGSGIIAETQLYGSRDKTYRNITLSSTDIKFVLIVFTKNNTYDLSFNLSLSESAHRIPYLPFGISPKLFVDKTDYYNDTVYPHMFGAVGDGVTDDTAALQLAIDYAVANKKLLKLSGGCTYLISNTLSWSGAYIRFDGNNATIKVSDIITPFTSKSLNNVFKINNLADLDDSAQSRYILRRFGNVNIDCNCGRAIYGIYIESGGKTVYQNIMINNPEYCGLRMIGGNEAVISNVHACQTDINYDDMRDDYKNSAAIYLSTSDNYAENCVSVDFVRGFATGGTDNHFSKCHAWNAHDKDKIKNSISFDVLGGYSTFSQCTVDSTKYGYYLHKQEYSSESARACIIGGVSAYNSIYVNNYAELGSPTLFYFAPEHTLKGKAVIVVSSNFKATSGISCNFDNLTDDDNKICIDQLIPHYENDAEVFWENAHYICINDKADKATTLDGYGINDAYTKDEVDNELAAKSDLVQSKNIFDFDTWAKGLQNLKNPVYNGTLDVVDFDKKSITYTTIATDGYTNGWNSATSADMKIDVKPNTTYTVSCNIKSNVLKATIYIFLNGKAETGTFFYVTNKECLTFTTSEDTSYITIRFGTVPTDTVTVSDIMIEEGEQKSLYLPYEVAEGVKELAQSTEERLAILENAMQDLILMTLGGE